MRDQTEHRVGGSNVWFAGIGNSYWPRPSLLRPGDSGIGLGGTYISAKSFADAAIEVARTSNDVPPGLAVRMEQIRRDVGNNITHLKSGLESWFDETMAVVDSQYKKWATTWLFFAGLGLAILVNASAINVASDMWHDSATRQAVVGGGRVDDVGRSGGNDDRGRCADHRPAQGAGTSRRVDRAGLRLVAQRRLVDLARDRVDPHRCPALGRRVLHGAMAH